MRIALRRLRLGMAEQASDDRQAHSAGDEVRGEGVPKVMDAHVFDPRGGSDFIPEFFDFRYGLARYSAGEDIGRFVVDPSFHLCQQSGGLGG